MADFSLNPPPPAYGVPQKLPAFAKRFSLPLRSVERWAALGKIPGQFQRGKRWFIRRSKASDAFGERELAKRNKWSPEDIKRSKQRRWSPEDLARIEAAMGMKIIPLQPPPKPPPKFPPSPFETPKGFAAFLDLAVSTDLEETRTFCELMKDKRFRKLAARLRKVFPRKRTLDIAAALMAAAFDIEPYNPTEDIREAEHRAMERKRQGFPDDPKAYRDLHLTETKAKRRRFRVYKFANALGLTRAAVYKAFKKAGWKKTPADVFRYLLSAQDRPPRSTDPNEEKCSEISDEEYSESD